MTKTISGILTAALLAGMAARAQQTTPPTQAPQMKEVPCPPNLPKSPKGIRFHLPKKIQDQLNKKLAGISQTTGVDLAPPSPADLAKQVQKPCYAPAAVTPPPIQPKQ